MSNQWSLLPQTGDPCWDTKQHKDMETTIAPVLTMHQLMQCCGKHQPPSCLGKKLEVEFAIGYPSRMGDLLCTPQWGGATQSPLGSHYPAAKQTYWNKWCLERNMHPRVGKGGGPGLAYPPQSISSGLTVLPPPANKYVMYSQVKLPISLSSRPRPGGHILFSAGTIICEHFVPSFGQENIMAQIEVLPELTQWALNDSQQSLSLLNTEMSLMRKAVLHNRMTLAIITALQGRTGAIIQTDCGVLIPNGSANVAFFFF